MSGSAISLPDRQVSDSVGNYALDIILVFFLAFQFFAKNTKGGTVWVCVGEGGGGGEMIGSLSFDVQGWRRGVSPFSDPFGQTEKGGRVGAKIGHFSWMS